MTSKHKVTCERLVPLFRSTIMFDFTLNFRNSISINISAGHAPRMLMRPIYSLVIVPLVELNYCSLVLDCYFRL